MPARRLRIKKSRKHSALKELRRSVSEELKVPEQEAGSIISHLCLAVRNATLNTGSVSVPGIGTFKKTVMRQTEIAIPKVGVMIVPTAHIVGFTMFLDLSLGAQHLCLREVTPEEREIAELSVRSKERLIKRLIGIELGNESVLIPRKRSVKNSSQHEETDNADN